MKRVWALFLLLALLCPAALGEVINLNGGREALAVGESAQAPMEYRFRVNAFTFADAAEEGKTTFAVRCYFQNLSHETVEAKDLLAFRVVYRERFEYELAFDAYIHVINESMTAQTCPLDPLTEIYGEFAAVVPKKLAEAGAGELLLYATVNGKEFELSLMGE